MYRKSLWLLYCAGFGLFFLWAAPSWSEEKKLESITVTANKIEEDVQEVPQSITVLNEMILDEKGIKDVGDLAREIPNMFMSTGVHGNAASFRGLNPSMFTNNNPVVLYIDGIPTTDRYSFGASLANVERVEVLRGPQGTLYGKDAIGGVINIVTKDPDNDWQGKVGVEYGRFNYMEGVFNFSGGLVDDKLFMGLNGQLRQDDGWITNIHEGMDNDADASKDRRLSGYLLYTPTDRFSARLILSHDLTEESWTKGYALPSGTGIDGADRDDAETVDFDYPTEIDRDRFSQSLHMTYDFTPVTLTSTTTHSSLDMDGIYDADYGNNPLYDGLSQFNYTDLEGYTQELRLSSNNEAGIRWVSGVYLDREDRDQGPYGMEFPNYDPATYAFIGNYEMNSESQTDSTTRAAFGQVMLPFGERFELTLGGRYQQIEKEIDLKMYYLPVGTAGPSMFTLAGEKDWDVFLPKAALGFKLNDSWNTYLSYSHGYMPGGFNYFATSGSLDDNSFEPQQSRNYEAGIKGTFDRLRLAAALFYMEIEDIHVYKAYGTGLYYTDNAESAHSQGIELEATYRLTDTVELSCALGLIEAEYDTYNAGGGISFDGEKIQNTPAYTAKAGITWMHPSGFYSRLDMRAAGKTYFYDDGNKDFVSEDAYVTFNAKIGYQAGAWEFYAYGKNLTDEDYILGFLSNSSLSLVEYGDPLTAGLGIRYRF